MTITEALAELKTLKKRIQKKREFVSSYAWRQDHIKDPHAKDGGSHAVIAAERQAIQDLQTRYTQIRTAIQAKNLAESITIGKVSKPIADWLVWRRDLAQDEQKDINSLCQKINDVRRQAGEKGINVVANAAAVVNAGSAPDIIVNLDEKKLHEEKEQIENTLGTLDGQLSLKNATLMIEV